jgi:hypothetical protein
MRKSDLPNTKHEPIHDPKAWSLYGPGLSTGSVTSEAIILPVVAAFVSPRLP